MKFIKNHGSNFIPTILILLFILIFSSCKPATPHYKSNPKPYQVEYKNNVGVEVKDVELLLDRCKLVYTTHDNYVNTTIAGVITNEIDVKKSHLVSYICILNYIIVDGKVIVRVYDLKVQRIKGKTTDEDYYLCGKYLKAAIAELNRALNNQINY